MQVGLSIATWAPLGEHSPQPGLGMMAPASPCTSARLAQSVEGKALNLVVVGSSPTVGEFHYLQDAAAGKKCGGEMTRGKWTRGLLHMMCENEDDDDDDEMMMMMQRLVWSLACCYFLACELGQSNSLFPNATRCWARPFPKPTSRSAGPAPPAPRPTINRLLPLRRDGTAWSLSLRCCPAAKATPRGFDPLRAEPNGFLVHLLSHSDKVS